MGHTRTPDRPASVWGEEISLARSFEGIIQMKMLKLQAVRVLLALGALAASGLALEAGRRWG
jgi:hypothetical protein